MSARSENRAARMGIRKRTGGSVCCVPNPPGRNGFIVAVTMGLALAHALELPGKLRLDEPTYLAVQNIYYPGFTIGGISEPLAIVAMLVLLLATPRDHIEFWWILAALLAVTEMQAVFWFVTQPTNRIWLKNEELSKTGAAFFAVERARQATAGEESKQDWKQLRDPWEYSHIVRAGLSGLALVGVVVAIAI
jgi:hypothetical protein